MSVIRHRPLFSSKRSVRESDRFRSEGAFERILLLADDQVIQQVKEPLEEDHFDVHTAKTMDDALNEIMNSNFDVVIYDSSFARFPFTTFYLALEKIRPQLLDRFLFLMGSPTEERITKFIERVDGLKVWRPVELWELFQMIEIVLGRKGVTSLSP